MVGVRPMYQPNDLENGLTYPSDTFHPPSYASNSSPGAAYSSNLQSKDHDRRKQNKNSVEKCCLIYYIFRLLCCIIGVSG